MTNQIGGLACHQCVDVIIKDTRCLNCVFDGVSFFCVGVSASGMTHSVAMRRSRDQGVCAYYPRLWDNPLIKNRCFL